MKLALALSVALLLPASLQKPGQRGKKPPPAPKPPVLNITCWPDRVEFGGEGSVATPNPIAAALGRAGPGTRIAVQAGDYPAFSVGFDKNAQSNARTPGGNANQPVTVEGVGKVRILPGKASDTVCISQQVPVSWITFKNLEIHCGYRAGIFFFGGDASLVFAGFKFHDCDVIGDSSKKAAVGFCFGGGNVLELARSGADLDAVVCLHGDLATTMPAKKGDIKAAVFVIHGSKDPVAPKADRDALEAELDGAEANWQLLDFGGRLHSFSEEETDMPGIAKYHPGAAHQTYRMLDDFIQDAFAKRL